MNKIFKLFVFISVLFVVVGLTGCAPTVNINTNSDPETLEISSADQLKTFMTNNSSTGKLTADVSIAEKLELKDGKDKTLDLNGKTITSNVTGSTSNAFYINGANTKLTIKDSTVTDENEGGKFVVAAAGQGVYVSGGAKLIVDTGTILAKANNVEAVYINSGADVEIKGGNVYAADEDDNAKGIAVKVANGTAKFTAGKLFGKVGIYVVSGSTVSEIGSITVDATEKAIYNAGTISLIKGGEFNVTNSSSSTTIYGVYNLGTITSMTNGDFSVTTISGQTGYGIHNRSTGRGTVTGGSFTVSGSGTKKNTTTNSNHFTGTSTAVASYSPSMSIQND